MPVEMPVAMPSEMPVAKPSEMPVEMPVAMPTEMPVAMPTEMPVAKPSEMPVEMPVAMPTEMPVATPSPSREAPEVPPMPTTTDDGLKPWVPKVGDRWQYNLDTPVDTHIAADVFFLDMGECGDFYTEGREGLARIQQQQQQSPLEIFMRRLDV